MTLRARLLLGFGLVLAALAISMVVVAASQRGYALDQLDRQLESAMPFALRPPLGAPLPGDPTRDAPVDSPASEFFVGIVDGNGEVTPVVTGELLDDVPAIESDDLEALGREGGTFTTGADHVDALPRPRGQAAGRRVVGRGRPVTRRGRRRQPVLAGRPRHRGSGDPGGARCGRLVDVPARAAADLQGHGRRGLDRCRRPWTTRRPRDGRDRGGPPGSGVQRDARST